MTQRPMQEPTFLILTALAAGMQHGYGIIIDVSRISEGRVRLRAGTLYAALDRLRADELIEVDHEEIVDGRLRRYYKLSEEGGRQLAAEAARLQANATAAITRLKAARGLAFRGSAAAKAPGAGSDRRRPRLVDTRRTLRRPSR
jgi:DNA-binding PadR family transcriptional regulator